MTPGARAAAAIAALDRILAGEPAEKVLTGWGRAARYAGSGDRAAVRDIVYDACAANGLLRLWAGRRPGAGWSLGRRAPPGSRRFGSTDRPTARRSVGR